MAITKERAAELADLLPDELSCTNARERLMCVLTMLRALTDASHTLSNADLRLVFEQHFGPNSAPSENTLAADVRALKSCAWLDLELHITPSGYWCERTQLTPPKVRMLLNAVQSSRFLTVAQSAELQEDLLSLVSRHQEDDLAGQVLVDQRVRKTYQQVFNTIDAVTRAINRGRKIEFVYSYSDFAGKAHPLEGDNGKATRIETPIALYFAEGNYYVETYTSAPWRHGIEVTMSRADRMIETRVSSEEADRGRKVYDLRRSAQRRLGEGFSMVSGPMRRIFLRVRSDATNVLFDRFGFGLRFALFEGQQGDPAATSLTLLKVPQAFTFFRWLSSAGQGIVMVEPPSELVLASGPWAKALRGVSRDELIDDHRHMVQGFLDYLDRARAPYLE